MPDEPTEGNEPAPSIQEVVDQYLSGGAPVEGGEPAPAAPAPSEPAPTPAPDVNQLLDAKVNELRGEFEQREAGYKETIDKQSQALNRLEALVGNAYQTTHAAPPEPEPVVTEADLVKDPIGTLNKVSDARSKKAVQEYSKGMSGVLQNIVERGYRGELSGLSKEKYIKYAKPEIEAMFAQNPALKLQPNSVEMAYHILVGKNHEDWEKKRQAEAGGDPPPATPAPATPAPPVPSGTPGSPGPPAPAKPAAELTQAQKTLAAKFANLGIEITPEDQTGG